MADNLTAPASGAVLATDDIGGVHYPRTKMSWGVEGAAIDVSATDPLPVALATGAATSAKQDAIIAAIGAVTYYPVTQPVSGTFWQATQPVSAASLPLPTGAAAETTLSAMSGKLPSTLGAKTGANSFSITPASDASFAITAASLPLPTGASTEATVSAMSAKLPSTLGIKTATNSLSIAPASDATFALAATESYVGKTGGDLLTVSATPTVSASPDYSAGDAIGGLMTFAAITRLATGPGIIQNASIFCKVANTAQIDLLLFNANPTATTITDNAAFDLNSADFTKLIGAIPITEWIAAGTPCIGQSVGRGQPIKAAASSTIYGVLVARGAVNLASTSDLTVTLQVVPG